ncbi:uncharacterized protein LOC114252692 [Bombyx mandarina]|uniref:Uncharacterized protein LOC114252692 n=1 Tax=Bombyx mandarina TaxID=7092 RepID=A0A6J2KNH7_BOMMA|nr:uncharacterized protein LOC114252692 [Bombyx mandarina]
MGDCLKLVKDKRHRSSSSLAGALDCTRSEKKLDIRASIPEVDDQFALAEARCDDLQDKIDLVRVLRKKKKLKKRSMTKVGEPQLALDNIPVITVRTQPKKKVSQHAARLRKIEMPHNPTRGYVDPASVEQHMMLGEMRGTKNYKPPEAQRLKEKPGSAGYNNYGKNQPRKNYPDGDSMYGAGTQFSSEGPMEVACGDDDTVPRYSDVDLFDQRPQHYSLKVKNPKEVRQVPVLNRRRHVPKENNTIKDETKRHESGGDTLKQYRGAPSANQRHINTGQSYHEERPVLELFNKERSSPPLDAQRQAQTSSYYNQDRWNKKKTIGCDKKRVDAPVRRPLNETGPVESKKSHVESKKEDNRYPRREKYRSHRYELPTVASQMKQAGVRYYCENTKRPNIPFIVSKSTAPSHNIGVNIQQVLNGLKVQQPLSGIPSTIAHHMGLGHVSTYGTRSATAHPSLDNREINVIKLGHRMLRLPSYKYMSYNRLLNLYREGDGIVPRFLKAINRPHYFYTSMYNSLTADRDDFDGATSKGRGGSQEAKQSLAEYASLYREYEHIEKCIKEGPYQPHLEQRKEELSKELASREEHIRKVVKEFKASGDSEQPLRASASTTEDGYRHSTFKLNVGDPQL